MTRNAHMEAICWQTFTGLGRDPLNFLGEKRPVQWFKAMVSPDDGALTLDRKMIGPVSGVPRRIRVRATCARGWFSANLIKAAGGGMAATLDIGADGVKKGAP